MIFGRKSSVTNVFSYSDYSPYGTLLDGRHGNETAYKYGYQGSEKDDELKGSGNSYTTHYRMLDPRIGRWFSTDPVFQPWQSPYTSMDNNPILNNDRLGNVANDKGRRYNNPDKAARKYAKRHGLNSENASFRQQPDGSIYISVATEDSEGVLGTNQTRFRASKWATKQHRKKIEAAFEAEREREYNNTHSIMSNIYTPNASLSSRPFYTNVNDVNYDVWMANRAKCEATDKIFIAIGAFYAALATGGMASWELAGTGYVTTGAVATYKGTVSTAVGLYKGTKAVCSAYHNTFGKNGGYVNFSKEVVNQTATQMTNGKGWSIGGYEGVGLFTSALSSDRNPAVVNTLLSIAPTYASFQLNGEVGGALFKERSTFHTLLSTGLALTPGLVNDQQGSFAAEFLTGSFQGLIDGYEDKKH